MSSPYSTRITRLQVCSVTLFFHPGCHKSCPRIRNCFPECEAESCLCQTTIVSVISHFTTMFIHSKVLIFLFPAEADSIWEELSKWDSDLYEICLVKINSLRAKYFQNLFVLLFTLKTKHSLLLFSNYWNIHWSSKWMNESTRNWSDISIMVSKLWSSSIHVLNTLELQRLCSYLW